MVPSALSATVPWAGCALMVTGPAMPRSMVQPSAVGVSVGRASRSLIVHQGSGAAGPPDQVQGRGRGGSGCRVGLIGGLIDTGQHRGQWSCPAPRAAIRIRHRCRSVTVHRALACRTRMYRTLEYRTRPQRTAM